jgi:hypothetical protein
MKQSSIRISGCLGLLLIALFFVAGCGSGPKAEDSAPDPGADATSSSDIPMTPAKKN